MKESEDFSRLDAKVDARRMRESERQSKIAYLESRLKEAEALLLTVRETIKDSDEWWMEFPDKGGFDLDAIEAYFKKYGEKESK